MVGNTMERRGRLCRVIAAVVTAVVTGGAEPCYSQRLLGIDISAWQNNISVANWNTLHTTNNRDFVFIRSSRGGTTGFDHNHDNLLSSNADCNGVSTDACLSRRYDDPYFGQNITRATNAGLFAGTYHRSRADVIASTPNTGGIANNGADEADHMMQMAGPWMRPGYLPPVLDFEDGETARTDQQMAQFALDFSNRMYAVMQIRPAIYVNGNYAQNVLAGGTAAQRAELAQQSANPPSVVSPAFPTLWNARWPNQANPNAIDVQNEDPQNTFANIFGPWDDYGVASPWAFWQYASTARLSGYANGGANIDVNVSHGDVEFVKDQLIPAVWWNNSSGDWSTLTNWNSGQPVVAPPVVANMTPVVGTTTLPTARLPGAPGGGPTSGQNDTVILERPNANITVTLSTGNHNIRKLYMRESLNITGGSLTINYNPKYYLLTDPDYHTNPDFPNAVHSGPISAQFSGPVTLGGTGNLTVHTLQVDANQTMTLAGSTGALTFDTIHLMPHSTTPARLAISGNVNIAPLSDATATIANGAGTGNSGLVDLSGGMRAIHVGDGSSEVDLSINVPITNGGFTKTGLGTMRLGGNNSSVGDVTINQGLLRYGHSSGLSANSIVTINNDGTLEMNNFSDTVAGLASDAGNSLGVLTQGSANLTISAPSGTSSFTGKITGTGTLAKAGGSTQILNGNNTLGPIHVGGGALLLNGINVTGAVDVEGGTIGGSAILSGPVTVGNGGRIAPGTGIGFFSTASTMDLETGSILDFELGSAGAGDKILVGGLLTIEGGAINIADGGGLGAGIYDLIDYGTLSGDIASFGTPIGPETFTYKLLDDGSKISVQVAAIVVGIPGDFNDDGIVDAADFLTWRMSEGTNTALPNDDGLGGVVGSAHYDLWLAHFGESLGSGTAHASSTAVPEPTAFVLLLIAASALGANRRRAR